MNKKKFFNIILKFVSILIFVFSIIFSFTFTNGYCLGDSFLKTINLPSWSMIDTGTHYTVLYSFALIFISFVLYSISCKNKRNTFINLLSSFLLIFIILNLIF